MTEDAQGRRRGLGRGLSALLGDDAEDYARLDQLRASKVVAIEQLRPNPHQPRRRFDEAELETLVESVQEVGMLQPILVRRTGEGEDSFEIVAGERRWRAAQRAQLHQVPVVIKDLDDAQSLKIALVENIQREDLNAIEEAAGYNRLIEEYGLTQEALSLAVGRSRSHIANTVRLLALPNSIQTLVEEGFLSAGHARALLGADNAEKLAKHAVSKQLSVRAVEALVKGQLPTKDDKGRANGKDANTVALEHDLSSALGLHVDISHKGDTGGSVRINYKTLEQLDEVCRRLCRHDDEQYVAINEITDETSGEYSAE
jgi:ParB family chromosome partitioning protein